MVCWLVARLVCLLAYLLACLFVCCAQLVVLLPSLGSLFQQPPPSVKGKPQGKTTRLLSRVTVELRAQKSQIRVQVMVVVGKHFSFFAYCGLVGNPHLTSKILFCLLPFQRQPRGVSFCSMHWAWKCLRPGQDRGNQARRVQEGDLQSTHFSHRVRG